MIKTYKFFIILLCINSSLLVTGQNSFFLDIGANRIINTKGTRIIIPEKFRTFATDTFHLKKFLWALPSETNVNRKTAPILELPMPDGSVGRYRVWESSIQEPGLEAKFPDIKTFVGQGVDDPFATIRFDYNPYSGLHAQVLTSNSRIYIDPYARGDINHYISYHHTDNKRTPSFDCEVQNMLNNSNRVLSAPCRGTQLYTFRLAVACTHEYANAVGGFTPNLLHAAIVTTINRVNQYYENELAIRLILVNNNNLIEFPWAGPDPFTGNNNANILIGESQTVITSAIQSPNFDIGHTFSTGAGGKASVGVVCDDGLKARGVTGSAVPFGDGYDIDYVAHEIGHQFGAHHTFNSTSGNCGSLNQWHASTAYEVGSGTTILGYAGTGICWADNIQPNTDPFFHSISFDEISNFVENGGSICKNFINTGNILPTITAMNNNGSNIPLNTPFKLSAMATDANNDAITYSWEEWDVGPSTAWDGGNTNSSSPLFKSRIPKANGSRTFPDSTVILAGYPTIPPETMGGLKGETLPTQARTLKFRLTVRDNRAGGGGVVSGGNGCQIPTAFQVNTIAGTGPFTVTVPNGGENYLGNASHVVTWNVAGTAGALINTTHVKISLSTDSGLTYPTVLHASTPNDGSEAVTIPNTPTSNARIKVDAVGNIFFDISDANFTIAPAAVLPDLVSQDYGISPITLSPGAQANIAIRLKNAGTGNAAASTAKFYFSRNQTLDNSSIDVDLNNDIAIPALNAGQSSNFFNSQISIPPTADGGIWHVVLAIDANNAVSESDESNNNVFYPVIISSPASVESDSLALVDLYNSTGGPNWTNKTNWLTAAPINAWYGISLQGLTRRVTHINLFNNNLTGSLPASIGNLTRLIHFRLENNHLSGSIPSSIENLIDLTYLNFRINQLTGPIPASIGNLINLITLELELNQLTGQIPSSVGNITNLSNFGLHNNQLSGEIPSSIGNLTHLTQLRLDGNQFTGSIPTSFGNITNSPGLALYVSYNQLSGEIPSSLGNIPHLTALALNNNQLTGEIPQSFSNLLSLTILTINNNKLKGSLSVLNSLIGLNNLHLHNNKFTFQELEPFVPQYFGSIISYAPQDTLLALHNNDCKLSLSAGGTLVNNTYQWWRNGQITTNITGDSTFIPVVNGDYSARITNSIATQLTLFSDTLVNFVPKPELGPARSKIFCPNTFGDISHLFDDTLNVHPEYTIVAWTSLSGIPINPTLASFGNTYLLIVQNATGCRDTGTVNTILYPIKNIAAAVPQTLIANRDSTDLTGWTHYYSGNILLLSIKKNGNNIGSINDGTFQVKVGATSGAGSGIGIHVTNPIFNNPSGSYIMNRYWNVIPTNQPDSAVRVRFYFTNQDYLDVKGSIPSLPTEQSLQFYKLDGGNADPTTNFAGANYIENLTHATTPSLFNWTYTFLGCLEHQAEFLVDHFSGGGGGATVNGNPFATPVPPTITSISPSSAPMESIVTINGSRFSAATAVSFGGTPATSFTLVSPNIITAKVSLGSSGNVSVTNSIGTGIFPGFNFISPPIITSFSPASGPVGTIVTINGTNFSSNASSNIVYFGGVKATVTLASPTSLTVNVPPGGSYQTITVTTNNLTGFSSKPFMVTFAGGGSIQSNSFDNKVDFAAAFNPTCVSIKDFDLDGKQDIAISNLNSGTINIYKNLSSNGVISFVQQGDVATNENNRSIASGDFDGDGKPDIAVPNLVGTVSVYKNIALNGNIYFSHLADYDIAANPRSILVHDFDSDGKPDIATANAGANSISVLRNNSSNGTISFAATINYTSGSTPYQVGAADIDNDGKTDIVCVNNASNTVSVLRNIGTPGTISFATKVDFTTGSGPRAVTIADINGDGKSDLSVSNYNASTLSVLNNSSSSGSISFAAKTDFTTGTNPWGISSTDIDGDGKADLSTGNFNASTISVLRNTSTGGITSLAGKIDLATGAGPIMISTADFNNDGKPDLITSDINLNTISILRNRMGDASEFCPGVNTSLTTDFSGTTYQWQVNTGSGFSNISDNANYSGTGSQTLQLNNIPSNFYGYQYSCLVNGVRSNISTLKFSNYWIGSVSSAWVNPLNWSCGILPDINTDVIINNGTVVVSSTSSCRSVTAKTGATVNVLPGVVFLISH